MKNINSKKPVYEGKAKIIYKGINVDTYIQYFKDDATAFNNKKKSIVDSKGIINNSISSHIFSYLNNNNIKTHFIKKINEREQLVKKVTIIPLEVVVRNIAAGSIVSRLGIKEGKKFSNPIIEFYYKLDKLNDPLVNKSHIVNFNWATLKELDQIQKIALQINSLLIDLFYKVSINLVDFKIEFGRVKNEIILADEISPDSCRLWDKNSGKKLDKDVFRNDLGDLKASYLELASRLGV